LQPSGCSAATTLGLTENPFASTLKGLSAQEPNAFSVYFSFVMYVPGLSLRSNHWAVISQRLRRIQ
ncbi:MAG TPA: hypothetical protein VHH35_02960, partial [Pyrinomonadaceae bacterium]|nr:hypothetical protein [Pyrinomonadaceae bacterium]